MGSLCWGGGGGTESVRTVRGQRARLELKQSDSKGPWEGPSVSGGM